MIGYDKVLRGLCFKFFDYNPQGDRQDVEAISQNFQPIAKAIMTGDFSEIPEDAKKRIEQMQDNIIAFEKASGVQFDPRCHLEELAAFLQQKEKCGLASSEDGKSVGQKAKQVVGGK